MEKRKSNGADGGDLRASKRLKVVEDKYAETPESTTKTGLEFLEQIRKTGDKNGRRIAKHFETLPPRRTNEDYYKAVRMPISLQDVEAKLKAGEFATLSELESYVKRMVLNAKDFYAKNSQQFEDAERVRKATSNFMVKHNPAYKLNTGYTAVATPIPDELLDADAAGEDEDDEGDADADAEAEADGDGDGNDDDGDDDKDAGDDDDEVEGEEEDDDAEEDVGPKTPGRRKSSSARSATRAVSVGGKQDGDYEGVPYKGLTFQQAQEKIMEEIIRRPDEEDESYAYFEPFFNLPSRSLKDYFQVIKDPLSIKKLQKLVKGIRSRTDRSGVSEFKSWAAFEEKASLLWENAYYYNEDGSVIANMAKDLEKMFRDELAQAKAVVAEPPQPKIKIKKAAATPVSNKKITIHVANTRGSSAESPAPKSVVAAAAGAASSRSAATPAAVDKALDKTRRLSHGVSPSPSAAGAAGATSAAGATGAKRESSSRASPALSQRPNGAASSAVAANGSPAPTAATNGTPAAAAVAGAGSPATNGDAAVTPIVPPKPAAPPRPAYESSFRDPRRQPLVTNITIRTHPALNAGDRRYEIQLPPHPKLTQRSVTLNIPPGQWRQQLYVSLNPAIHKQLRPFKMFVISNGATLGPVPASAAPPAPDMDEYTKLYEVNLHPGVNVVQVQLIVGLAKGQTLPNGADAELEKLTIFANMMKV